jgi:hypothetical protein
MSDKVPYLPNSVRAWRSFKISLPRGKSAISKPPASINSAVDVRRDVKEEQ